MSNTLSRPQAKNAGDLRNEVGILDVDAPGFVEGYEDEIGDFEPEPRANRTRRPSLPGEILRDLYLPPTGVTLTELAALIGVSRRTVSQIVNGSRPVSVDVAHRLARAFGTSPTFWLGLQRAVDEWDAAHTHGAEYEQIPLLRRAA